MGEEEIKRKTKKEWEKILVNHISDKGSIPRIHINSYNATNRNQI